MPADFDNLNNLADIASTLADLTEALEELFSGGSATDVTFAGDTKPSFDKRWQQWLASSGYESLGDYDTDGPLTIETANQIFSKDDEFYRPKPSLALPYETLDAWSVDSEFFIPIGDAGLRQELALATGAEMVGTSSGGGEDVESALKARLPCVDTLSDFKVAGYTIDTLVYVKGRAAVNDGYGGFFLVTDTDYSAEAALDTQEGVFVDLGDGLFGRRQFEGSVNSDWFGGAPASAPHILRYTGSVIDCEKAYGLREGMSASAATTVFQQIVSDLNGSDGKQFLIPGYEYEIGDPIGELDVTARDAGLIFSKGSSISLSADLGGTFLVCSGTGITSTTLINRFRLQGLFIKNPSSYAGQYLKVSRAQYFDLFDIRLVGCIGIGLHQEIHWDSVCERIVILDCGDASSSLPGHLVGDDDDDEYCNNLFFTSYHQENMPYVGLELGGRSRGNMFHGYKFHGSQSFNTEAPMILLKGGHGTQLIGGRLLNPNQNGLELVVSSSGQQPNGNIITGVINNAGANSSAAEGYGARLTAGGQVRGNIFNIAFGFQTENRDGDIYIEGSGQRNNNFAGCTHFDMLKAYGAGSQLPSSENVNPPIPLEASDAELNDISSEVNNTLKFKGVIVFNTTQFIHVYAFNSSAGSVWRKLSDNSTANTPI